MIVYCLIYGFTCLQSNFPLSHNKFNFEVEIEIINNSTEIKFKYSLCIQDKVFGGKTDFFHIYLTIIKQFCTSLVSEYLF